MIDRAALDMSDFVRILFAVALVSAVLYFGRIVLEPVAFALFGLALVWPVQKTFDARMPSAFALLLTIVFTLVVFVVFAMAIIWSFGDVIHWVSDNLPRFQARYRDTTEWLEARSIYLNESSGLFDNKAVVRFLQEIALALNSFAGFCLVVFLLLAFGLPEVGFFSKRFDELEPKIGYKISVVSADIAQKIRKYMAIRTAASVLTGIAVFIYTYYISLDLAVAWAVISFVLNYIPYFGSLIAVALPVLFSVVQFHSWQTPLILFGGLYFIQFFIGNYLEPVMTGKAFAVSPFVMLIAFFYWGFVWGLPGAFIGLPMTIAFLTICQRDPSLGWVVRLLMDSS